MPENKWWKEVIVYQIYPRSFMDSNGDGIGDIRGIISKLDYIKDLGCNMLWLTPIFESPNNDNGYDISDYYKIGSEYGNMDDFEELIFESRKRDIGIIMDMVFNHTSDEHPWFIESRKGKNNSKRNYYYWRDGKKGKEPNNWSSGFEPSCWTYDEKTDQYYLHYYSKKMPDLNWEEPEVRKEIHSILKFWVDKGVKGFRFDSLNLIKKLESFEDATTPDPFAKGYFYDEDKIYNIDGIMDFISEMHDENFAKNDLLTVGETSVTSSEVALQYVHKDAKGVQMVFNFEPVEMEPFKLDKLKEIHTRWYKLIENGGYACNYLSNHDQPRQVSKFGNQSKYWNESAKLLATLNIFLYGVPFIYQGEEIGMTNVEFENISEYNDIATINRYKSLIDSGIDENEALKEVSKISRDNARTPMQWSYTDNAGFSESTPWLNLNSNYKKINVSTQIDDPDSILTYYKNLIRIRNENEVLKYGDFKIIDDANENVYQFERRLDNYSIKVILNFASLTSKLKFEYKNYELLINSNKEFCYLNDSKEIELSPWQAIVLKGSGKDD